MSSIFGMSIGAEELIFRLEIGDNTFKRITLRGSDHFTERQIRKTVVEEYASNGVRNNRAL